MMPWITPDGEYYDAGDSVTEGSINVPVRPSKFHVWNGEWVIDPQLEREMTVPISVTMRQARLALLNAGLLQSVNNTIQAMTGQQGEAARIEWDYSNEVRRDQPLTIALAQAIGMTPEQMDNLFVEAAKL